MPIDSWKRRARRRHKLGYSVTVTYGDTTFVPASEFKELKVTKRTKKKTKYYTLRKGELMTFHMIKKLQKEYPKEKGFQIWVNEVTMEGVDILITHATIPYLVMELTNYSKTSYIPYEDIQRYIENLSEWSCKRVLVVCYPSNLYNKKLKMSYFPLLKRHNIEVWYEEEQRTEKDEEYGYNLWEGKKNET